MFKTKNSLTHQEVIRNPIVRAVEFTLVDAVADDSWSFATLKAYF